MTDRRRDGARPRVLHGLLASLSLALVHCDSGRTADAGGIDVVDRVAASAPYCQRNDRVPAGIVVPDGFCVRTFAHVQHARVIRFAPGGELFVASPNTPTTSYVAAGPEPSRIALVPDDDRDGVGDAVVTFLSGVDACHALLFGPGAFYYSVDTQILRMQYAAGQRTPGTAVVVANLSQNASFVHWPHTMDLADDGTVYVSRGGDEMSTCPMPRPTRGAIVALNGTLEGRVVANGLRNPMYLRCAHGRGRCYANELTGDFWDALGATEKIIPIRDGDDWGYPCCIARGAPIPDAGVDCSSVASGERTVPLHDTPFGMDFESGTFPAPWTHSLFVALHGQFVTWRGARVVAIDTDPTTGAPRTDTPAVDFATGWDDGQLDRGRPSDVTFAPDGRLFVANDITGEIVWIAPIDLRPPQ